MTGPARGELPTMGSVADLHHIGLVTARVQHRAVVARLLTSLDGTVEYEVEDDPLDILATWVLVTPRLRFEVVSPRSEADTPVTRFLRRTGGGLHHVSLATTELGVCKELASRGSSVVGENDDHGGWAEFFLDPHQTGMALLHWMQPVDESAEQLMSGAVPCATSAPPAGCDALGAR